VLSREVAAPLEVIRACLERLSEERDPAQRSQLLARARQQVDMLESLSVLTEHEALGLSAEPEEA